MWYEKREGSREGRAKVNARTRKCCGRFDFTEISYISLLSPRACAISKVGVSFTIRSRTPCDDQ
jgi:hypothetical protein